MNDRYYVLNPTHHKRVKQALDGKNWVGTAVATSGFKSTTDAVNLMIALTELVESEEVLTRPNPLCHTSTQYKKAPAISQVTT